MPFPVPYTPDVVPHLSITCAKRMCLQISIPRSFLRLYVPYFCSGFSILPFLVFKVIITPLRSTRSVSSPIITVSCHPAASHAFCIILRSAPLSTCLGSLQVLFLYQSHSLLILWKTFWTLILPQLSPHISLVYLNFMACFSSHPWCTKWRKK